MIKKFWKSCKDTIRKNLRQWLGIIYLDNYLSGRIRDLEGWRDSCIVAMPVDHHFKGKDIIILAGRFGDEDKVKIIAVEFKRLADMIELARSLEQGFAPKRYYYWDGPPGYTKFMRREVE